METLAIYQRHLESLLGFRPEVELMETKFRTGIHHTSSNKLGFRPEVELMET